MPEEAHHEDPLLRMEGMVKDFSGTRALDGVDFDVRPGEVHALIGENGAGKSTLMNVLAGRFNDYRGSIVFEGRPQRITHPQQALRMGIAVIFQELRVLENFTVAENILLGEERRKPWTRRMDRAHLRGEAQKVIRYLGFDLDPDERVQGLSRARQCLVEIAGAVRRNAKLLVFDEPTASLGSEDVDRLFQVIRDLKARGLCMVYISHRLAELHRIADRVTVLRDGKKVGTLEMAACRLTDLTRMMLGHDLGEVFPPKTNQPGEVILRVRGLTRPGVFEGVSFDLRKGEILGLAGLVGSGRTEIARALFGADGAEGAVELRGRPLGKRSPFLSRLAGLGMVPENRKVQGSILGRPVKENITVTVLDRLSGALGLLRPRRVRDRALALIERMEVDPPLPEMEIQHLSGGNQQKVMVGRWLAAESEVLIFDEPTQGIDVGTKAQLYKLIMDLACQGRAVIIISSELIELINLADRILVLREGKVKAEMEGSGADEESLFFACAGKADQP